MKQWKPLCFVTVVALCLLGITRRSILQRFPQTQEVRSGLDLGPNRQLVLLTVAKKGCTNPDFLPGFIPVPGFCLDGCENQSWKVRCVLAGLREIQRQKLASHVLMADHDVFMSNWTPGEIFEVFDSFNQSIVVSAERTLWCGPFKGKMNYDFGENLYVNSGAYMGEIDSMVKAFEEMREAQAAFQTNPNSVGKPTLFSADLFHTKERGDDQTMLNLYVNAHFDQTVTLDSDRLLFYSLVDMVSHRCWLDSKNRLEFIPPIDTWDESWCEGYYVTRNRTEEKIKPWRTLRNNDNLFCTIHPSGAESCMSEWGIDAQCQAFANAPPHDPYLVGGRTPLLLHTNGPHYKKFLQTLAMKWRDRCPPSQNFTVFPPLLVLEENQRRRGIPIPLTDWDLFGKFGE